MFNKRWQVCAVAVLSGAALVAATSTPASASGAPPLRVVKTISTAYYGPLQFAVDGKKIFVADEFTSTLNQVGVATPLASNPGNGHDLPGVGVDAKTGAIAYTTSTAVGEEGVHTASALTILRPGHKAQVVNLFAFEKSHNPDRIRHYGVVGHVSSCVRKAVTASGGLVKYSGEVDTHPYAVASLGGGSWAVADAGGNDILRVEPNGNVFTLAVLPDQPFKITADFAKQNGLPACTIGVTYRDEAVPTDVEVGPKGELYVSTLPGGIGALGSVYKLSAARYNTAHLVATGIPSATNLAVDKAGNIYVASLFAGEIFEVRAGMMPMPVLGLPAVAAIEFANGHLYASTAPAALTNGSGTPPKGSIVLLGR